MSRTSNEEGFWVKVVTRNMLKSEGIYKRGEVSDGHWHCMRKCFHDRNLLDMHTYIFELNLSATQPRIDAFDASPNLSYIWLNE